MSVVSAIYGDYNLVQINYIEGESTNGLSHVVSEFLSIGRS